MRARSAFALGFLLVFLAGSRAAFWTAHPPNFDFANFALGVYRYAPVDHQPYPPGYPLAISTARLFLAAGVAALRAHPKAGSRLTCKAHHSSQAG